MDQHMQHAGQAAITAHRSLLGSFQTPVAHTSSRNKSSYIT
jgi:hypothetical protein